MHSTVAQAPGPSALKKLLAFVKRYSPLLTLCGSMIGFGAGYAVKVIQYRQTERDKIAEDWQAALDKNNTDGRDQIYDALRIQEFESYKQYRAKARQVEFDILSRMSDTNAFDLVYFQLQDTSNQSEMVELEDFDRNLSGQIRWLMNHATFPPADAKLDADTRLKEFLLSPAQYLSDATMSSRADALIYELDSVSGGLQCVWLRTDSKCPPLHPTGTEDSNMILVNHDFSSLFLNAKNQPSLFKTCSAQTIHGIGTHDSISCE